MGLQGNTKMSKVKNENYITILGFMVNELKLKGNELLIYAIIYGFSQNQESKFEGSLQYLADWINGTKQTVIACLKSLTEKGLIEKEEIFLNGIKFCRYIVKKFEWGSQNSLMGVVKNFERGSQNFLPNNNIYNNNIYNNINNNVPSFEKETKEYSKDAIEISQFLYNSCQENDSKFFRTERQLDQWTSDIEKLNRIDKRDYVEIWQVMKWCRNNTFWKPNIMSGSKFRQKYEMLLQQMKNDKRGNPNLRDYNKHNEFVELMKRKASEVYDDEELKDVPF